MKVSKDIPFDHCETKLINSYLLLKTWKNDHCSY